MKEADLRRALAEKAQEFAMTDPPPGFVVKKIRRRVVLSVLRGAVVVTVLVGGGSLAFSSGPRMEPQRPEKLPLAIELVDDYVDDGHQEGSGEDAAPSRQEVQSHVECMREQGFDLPDPIRTGRGWEIQVEDSESLDWETPRWREAAFVACRPSPPPGPGDLVLGIPLSEETIQDFERCIEGEGFDLPEPMANPEGEGWIFDLSETDVDFGDADWNRAVFVTCWSYARP